MSLVSSCYWRKYFLLYVEYWIPQYLNCIIWYMRLIIGLMCNLAYFGKFWKCLYKRNAGTCISIYFLPFPLSSMHWITNFLVVPVIHKTDLTLVWKLCVLSIYIIITSVLWSPRMYYIGSIFFSFLFLNFPVLDNLRVFD